MSPQKKTNLTFAELVSSIRQAHDLFSAQASKAVNISLTLRNWAIGYYIERYERLGVDRAKYGERLMDDLSETLRKLGLSRCDRRELYRYQQFCLTYPQIVEAAPQLTNIGSKQCFVDMVFYHRILKCHVLIELKVDEFNHEHLGQLNTYVNWYKKNVMPESDNPPVGILLCTQKDHALVEYALAGMNNKLFVSKYQLELPKKEEMQRFIEEQMREVQG